MRFARDHDEDDQDDADIDNDAAQAVRLYLPIPYDSKRSIDQRTESFIGGIGMVENAKEEQRRYRCEFCQQPLYSLAQLYTTPQAQNQTSSGQILQVWACNRAACIHHLFRVQDGARIVDGRGAIISRRFVLKDVHGANEYHTTSTVAAMPPSNWIVGANKQDNNEWVDSDIDTSDLMANLEAKLAAMETRADVVVSAPISVSLPKSGLPPAKTLEEEKNTSSTAIQTRAAFPCFRLHSQPEPIMSSIDGIEEDDVGMSGERDDKIQQMLARYMAEEDDPLILAALRDSSGLGAVASTEKDERLSAEDKALLAFSDRLKYNPHQVIRYSYGGAPLWSIPVESAKTRKRYEKQRKKNQKHPSKVPALQPTIPKCPCGGRRVFEMQLLPSLLHVLEVDKGSLEEIGGLDASFSRGAMNWGNICVYTCSQFCENQQEFVLVQESIDELPTQRKLIDREDIIIDENAKFDEVLEDMGDSDCDLTRDENEVSDEDL